MIVNNCGKIKESSLPEVTVAVCVYNGEDTIRECLDSIMSLNYPQKHLKVLVVNNASTDQTSQIVDQYPVEQVMEPLKGRGNARNKAWKSCKTPFLAFTDADCTVSPDWLKELMPLFEDESLGVVGGDIMTPGTEPLAQFFEHRQIVSNREFSGNYPFSPPFLATANSVFRLEAIQSADGFLTHFCVAEDADICWRLKKNGFSLKYIEGAVVFHHHRTTTRKMFQQAIEYGHDGIQVYIENFNQEGCWIWWGLYYRWLMAIPRIPVSLLKRDPFLRRLPLLDFIRYTGLIVGRLKAAINFKKLIL